MRWSFLVLFLLFGSFAAAQSDSGELRLKVKDASGLGVRANVAITSAANQYHATFTTGDSGALSIPHLPLGVYSVQIQARGFAPVVQRVEIRSSVPQILVAPLAVAGSKTTLTVTDKDTLLDPNATGSVERLGAGAIADRQASLPGRSLQDLVDSQPGWLYEGNAVLHPRGSEYQTQLVVDGIPLTDDRSPGMGPAIDVDDIQSMSIYTADFPAEYGRKLGGVIEINTARNVAPGFHGKIELAGGSFDTRNGYADLQTQWGANTLTFSGGGGATDWYLNPPVLQNYTNSGTIGNYAIHYERELDPNDRIALTFRQEQSRFGVPNEQVQQAAGQQQDRGNNETIGALSYQHVFSANLLADLRLMARSLDATLTSNPESTPIIAAQNRSYSEQYAKAMVSYHHGVNDWKAGVEADFATIDEYFADRITDFTQFDPGTPARFSFSGSAPDREQAAFVQDTLHVGGWTANFGLRWDHDNLLVDRNAVSPRVGVARYFKPLELVLHASYDRVFQTPSMENILVSSSPAVVALNPQVLRLPVEPSLGNDYQVGASKEFAGTVRAEVNYFLRTASNFADDDQLLSTAVSFPVAFRKASIYGAETKVDLPQWKRLSGFVSYSYMVGFASLPVTGGLFLGDDATAALSHLAGRFPISQDQRNTLRTRYRYELTSRLWIAAGAEYGSGLPVEFDGTPAQALAQYGPQIVDRVNFVRGRIYPNLSIDASLGAELWKHEKKSITVQADGENLNDRVNLIDFAGLFSGNALEPPRSWHLRMTLNF